MIITSLLAGLIAALSFATTQTNVPPTSFTYAQRDNGAGFTQLQYGNDKILAMTDSKGHYVIDLCSTTCRHSDTINLNNAPFIAAARAINCEVFEDGSWTCPNDITEVKGTSFEDGSVVK